MSDVQKITADLGTLERVETGALQINDDWPGLFLRGDSCIDLLQRLELIKEALELHVPKDKQTGLNYVYGLLGIKGLISMIEGDVLIKPRKT